MPIRRAAATCPPLRTRGTDLPDATVARLPLYHRVLVSMEQQGVERVSSADLADAVGVSSAVLRKDLSHLGSYGTRGVGYDVAVLAGHLSRAIGLTQSWPVVIVGAGNLGHALAAYRGFDQRGFVIVGIFDVSPGLIGTDVAGSDLVIRSAAELEQVILREGVRIGVIATGAAQARAVCDRLVAAGVTSILNFAPTALTAPDGVEIRDVDLAIELHLLAYHQQRRLDIAAAHTMGERVS